jgi:hypothetical protein
MLDCCSILLFLSWVFFCCCYTISFLQCCACGHVCCFDMCCCPRIIIPMQLLLIAIISPSWFSELQVRLAMAAIWDALCDGFDFFERCLMLWMMFSGLSWFVCVCIELLSSCRLGNNSPQFLSCTYSCYWFLMKHKFWFDVGNPLFIYCWWWLLRMDGQPKPFKREAHWC